MISRKDILPIIAIVLIGVLAFNLIRRTNSSKLLDTKINPALLPNKQRANTTKEFVERAVKNAENGESDKDLDKLRNGDEYLIGYNHDGTLLVHGVSTDVFCDREFPTCNASGKKLIGKDLYNFKTAGGVYEVRLWLDIANNGGGWAAAYWKDPSGNFKPKYYYIRKVPNRDLVLASGYFA